MEKPNKFIFGFDYALMSPAWKALLLPGVNRIIREIRHGNPWDAILPHTVHR